MLLAKQAGFTGIELTLEDERGNADDDFQNLTMSTSDEQIRSIAVMAQEIGLKLPSIATGLLWRYPLTSSDENERRQGARIVERMIEVAHILGADTVLVVPGLVNDTVTYKDAYNRALDTLNYLKGIAETYKIYIGIENVWNKFLLSPMEMANFIDKIDSPYVGAYFDVGNVLAFGYPQHWIEILQQRIKKVHIKDFKTAIGNITGFTNLLEGDVNWPAVMDAFAAIGYDDYIICELSPYRTFPQKLIYDASNSMDYIISNFDS